jgi:hypothetical protein
MTSHHTASNDAIAEAYARFPGDDLGSTRYGFIEGAKFAAARAPSPSSASFRGCQCVDPMIKCDQTGCRCTLCGKIERLAATPAMPAPADAEPVAWAYFYDGMMEGDDNPIVKRNRSTAPTMRQEPWTECPLYARPASPLR